VAVEAADLFCLGGLVHADHGGVFAVADVTFEGAGFECQGKQRGKQCEGGESLSLQIIVPPEVSCFLLMYPSYDENALTQIKNSLSKIDNLCYISLPSDLI
jgi:hypothetical protein